MFVKLMYNNDIFLRGAILLKLLEDRIVKDGIVKPGNVLKVDSFLNHQMDISLFNDRGLGAGVTVGMNPFNLSNT